MLYYIANIYKIKATKNTVNLENKVLVTQMSICLVKNYALCILCANKNNLRHVRLNVSRTKLSNPVTLGGINWGPVINK